MELLKKMNPWLTKELYPFRAVDIKKQGKVPPPRGGHREGSPAVTAEQKRS